VNHFLASAMGQEGQRAVPTKALRTHRNSLR
jgi:hypothetical protein